MNPILLWTLADTTTSNADILSVFLQYGVLGVFAVILLMYTRASIQREQKRSDGLEAKNDSLNSMIQERTIPALVTATEAVNASNDLLAEMKKRADEQVKATEAIQAAQRLLADTQYRADATRQAAEAAEAARTLTVELAEARKRLVAEQEARKALEAERNSHGQERG